MSNMQDQAVMYTWAMADRLAGRADSWAALGGPTVGAWRPGASQGRNREDLPRGAG